MILITSILTAVLFGTLPLMRMLVSSSVVLNVIKIATVLVLVTFILLLASLIVHPQLIIKISAIPVTYVFFMIGYILNKSNALNIFKAMISASEIPMVSSLSHSGNLGYMFMLNIGLFISFIPLIIVGIFKVVKLNRKHSIDFSSYYLKSGKIISVEDTHLKLNKVKVYKVSIAVGSEYQHNITKEIALPYHVIHSISIGKLVNLRVNPSNANEIYIENEYGYF